MVLPFIETIEQEAYERGRKDALNLAFKQLGN